MAVQLYNTGTDYTDVHGSETCEICVIRACKGPYLNYLIPTLALTAAVTSVDCASFTQGISVLFKSKI